MPFILLKLNFTLFKNYRSPFLLNCNLRLLCYRITDWLKLKRISGCHLVQPPWTSRANYSWLPRVVSSWFLNIFMGGNSTSSLYNLCQCLVTFKVKVFPDTLAEPHAFQFVFIASGSATGHHWGEPGPVCFTPSLQIFIHPNKNSSLSLFFSRQSGPISPSLFAEERSCGLFITFVTLCWTSSTVYPCLSCTGEPMDWTQHSRKLSAVLSRRGGSHPLTCWPSSASCRPGGSCPYLPQHHIIREKASYYYGINADTHLFLELNGRYLKLNVIWMF